MQTQNCEPRTPLTAVILTALVIGYAWGLTSLMAGMSGMQRPSSPPSVGTGHSGTSGERGDGTMRRAKPIHFCELCQDRPATIRKVFCWGSMPGCPVLTKNLCRWCLRLAAPSVTLLRMVAPILSDQDDEENDLN